MDTLTKKFIVISTSFIIFPALTKKSDVLIIAKNFRVLSPDDAFYFWEVTR